MKHPMGWFRTDENGRWPELTNKLSLNDLEYKGTKVVVEPEAALENVRTCHATCLKDGAPQFPCPNKPHSYSEVVEILRKKGLIASIPLQEEYETDDQEIERHRREVRKGSGI